MSGSPVRISVIVPAFNERDRLPRTLATIEAYAARHDRDLEIIVVDDGSRDDTADAARRFAAEQAERSSLRVLVNADNRGKGYSVRRGMLAAEGDALLLSDADLSTPIEELEKLLPWLEHGDAVVIGSRAMGDSVLDPPQPFLRRLMGRAFGMIRRLIILPDIRDTQCGFKLFTRDAARRVFQQQEAEGFAFDCEVLALARREGLSVREVGVVWRDDRASTVRPVRDALAILGSLLRIRRRVGRGAPVNSARGAREKATARS